MAAHSSEQTRSRGRFGAAQASRLLMPDVKSARTHHALGHGAGDRLDVDVAGSHDADLYRSDACIYPNVARSGDAGLDGAHSTSPHRDITGSSDAGFNGSVDPRDRDIARTGDGRLKVAGSARHNIA